MAMTEPTIHGSATGAVSGRDVTPHRAHRTHETKAFPKTSEFWAMLIGIAAIAAIYNAAADASLDLWRACLLGTMVAIAYIVSRGLAKAGTRHGMVDGQDGYR